MPAPDARGALLVDRLSVSVAGRPLLADISFELPTTGLTWLVGPVASGKTTLLRAIAGMFAATSNVDVGGLVDAARPARLVGLQPDALLLSPVAAVSAAVHARGSRSVIETQELAAFALTEVGLGTLRDLATPVAELPLHQRRLIAVAQAVASEAGVIMLDEPTAGLGEAPRSLVLRVIEQLALRFALMVVSHNQNDLRAVPGALLFLAGGRILERGDSQTFLEAPVSTDAQRFVASGGCATPSLAMESAKERVRRTASTWIKWVMPDRLAGTRRPGLLRDLDVDLEALHEAGFSVLVCLEERVPYDLEVVRAFGFEFIHVPIADMQAPSVEALGATAALVKERVERGSRVLVHCRAGLGRTGTVLAAVLVMGGLDVADAIREIRRTEPRFIQSDAQLAAVHGLRPTPRET